jgi:monofunctional biosynthetic peptidoglycan transglycosylase
MLLLAAGTAMLINLSIEHWTAVNDGVMGGVSSGTMTEIAEGLSFRGNLSLENNGGFSSVRKLVREDASKTRGVRLTVRGDGRRYQLRLRQDREFDGVAWRVEFETRHTWQTLEFDYSEFVPVFRGREVRSAGPVDPAQISQIGFLIADSKPGAFQLDVQSLELITAGPR